MTSRKSIMYYVLCIKGKLISLLFLPIILATYYLLQTTPVFAADPGPAGVGQLQELIQRIINLSVAGAFIVLLIMLIFAGIKFLTSGGEPKALGQASGTITWALLGILFLIIAWLILKLIEAFTGVPVTKFCIGFDC